MFVYVYNMYRYLYICTRIDNLISRIERDVYG